MFFRVARRFIYGERGINALPETHADTALPIADDNYEAEIETPPARHHARDAARVNRHLFELPALAWRSRAAAAARSSPAQGSAAAAASILDACGRYRICRRSVHNFRNRCDVRIQYRFLFRSRRHTNLENETAFARRVRKRFYLPAITVAGAVKDD